MEYYKKAKANGKNWYILNNKVKLTFNDFPETAGNYGVFDKKEWVENISFNYNRSESDLEEPQSQLLSDYQVLKSIETVFNSLLSDRSNNEIWKIFVILTLLFLFLEVCILLGKNLQVEFRGNLNRDMI